MLLSALADPYRQVKAFGIPLMNSPALAATIAYELFSLYRVGQAGLGQNIGHGAHLVGAAFGAMYYLVGCTDLGVAQRARDKSISLGERIEVMAFVLEVSSDIQYLRGPRLVEAMYWGCAPFIQQT